MSLPGGLTLYWLVITLITVLQQIFVFKVKNDIKTNSNTPIESEIVK